MSQSEMDAEVVRRVLKNEEVSKYLHNTISSIIKDSIVMPQLIDEIKSLKEANIRLAELVANVTSKLDFMKTRQRIDQDADSKSGSTQDAASKSEPIGDAVSKYGLIRDIASKSNPTTADAITKKISNPLLLSVQTKNSSDNQNNNPSDDMKPLLKISHIEIENRIPNEASPVESDTRNSGLDDLKHSSNIVAYSDEMEVSSDKLYTFPTENISSKAASESQFLQDGICHYSLIAMNPMPNVLVSSAEANCIEFDSTIKPVSKIVLKPAEEQIPKTTLQLGIGRNDVACECITKTLGLVTNSAQTKSSSDNSYIPPARMPSDTAEGAGILQTPLMFMKSKPVLFSSTQPFNSIQSDNITPASKITLRATEDIISKKTAELSTSDMAWECIKTRLGALTNPAQTKTAKAAKTPEKQLVQLDGEIFNSPKVVMKNNSKVAPSTQTDTTRATSNSPTTSGRQLVDAGCFNSPLVRLRTTSNLVHTAIQTNSTRSHQYKMPTGNGIPSLETASTAAKMKVLKKPTQVNADIHAPLVKYIYVGRLLKGTSVEQISAYLKYQWPNGDFTCADLKNKGRHCSFKVGSGNISIEELLNLDMWPSGVLLKPFKFVSKFYKQPRAGYY